MVPNAQVDVSDAESESNGSGTGGETAELVKRCNKKEEDKKHEVRRGR
jgi:hypothetical protein